MTDKSKTGKRMNRSISLKESTFAIVYDFADKYFQGNVSVAIGYICTSYFEYKDSLDVLLKMIESGSLQQVGFESTLNQSNKINGKKETFDFDTALDNLKAFDEL